MIPLHEFTRELDGEDAESTLEIGKNLGVIKIIGDNLDGMSNKEWVNYRNIEAKER